MKHQLTMLLSVLLVLGLGQASASPIGRVLSRLLRTAGAGGSSASSRGSIYRQLHANTLDLDRHQRTLFTAFKEERYPDEPSPSVKDVEISYLPTTRNFPSARENHSDEELLDLHYANLVIFKDTLMRVEETETGNITYALTTAAEKLHEVVFWLETAIQDVSGRASDRPEPNNPPFHSNVTTEEQNTRTLLVLQKFDSYIGEVLIDYATLKTRYS